MLEPCEVKVSCTVLRGERGREAPDLPDCGLLTFVSDAIDLQNIFPLL